MGEAIRLWQLVVEHDPTRVTAALNLAVVECGSGEKEAAMGTLERTLEFSPDEAAAEALLEEIRTGRRACGGR